MPGVEGWKDPGGGVGVKTLNPCVRSPGYTTVKGDEGARDFQMCLDVARLLLTCWLPLSVQKL